MTTVAAVIDRLLGPGLLGGGRVELNMLDGALLDSDTTVTLTYGAALAQGAILEVDSELMYVWEWDPDALEATVQRGYRGTTAEGHGDKSLVRVDPWPARVDVWNELVAEFARLNDYGLYRHGAAYTVESGGCGAPFDLSLEDNAHEGMLGVYEVVDAAFQRVQYRVQRERDVALFPSGWSLRILDGGPGPYWVVYNGEFEAPTGEQDDLEGDCGLLPVDVDVLLYGAAYRLMAGREAHRVQTQAAGGARPAGEVQEGANAFVGNLWLRMRDEAVATALAARRRERPMGRQR